jgi:hypothetical protein
MPRLAALLTLLAAVALPANLGATSMGRVMTVQDRAGDTRARDLDIRQASLVLDGGTLAVKMTMAAAVRNNSIYSGMFACGSRLTQLGVKRAAGVTTIFLFDWNSPRQIKVPGFISGPTVGVSAPARKMGCAKGLIRFGLTAEGTNGRPRMTDSVPQRGKLTYKP